MHMPLATYPTLLPLDKSHRFAPNNCLLTNVAVKIVMLVICPMAENNSWMIGYYYLNEWVKKNFEWVAHRAVHGMQSFKAVMGFQDHKGSVQSKQLENLKSISENLRSFAGSKVSGEKAKILQEKNKSGFRSDKFQVLTEKIFSKKEDFLLQMA